ncbi:hypothetical protein D0Y65_018521 [Glycine soja]|uniref:Uncharacterized protein n=1 Tax=Glycine soja TaxID=3848 RepID=A0A445JZX0_GLYSO|nr:hypothetical protein D0Y65_018521 [Glycine soja]
MGEVDPAFIQYLQHRPKFSTIQPEDIPVIDISPITNHTASDPCSIGGLVKEIRNASKEWGFFQLSNHAVPLTLRQNIEKASRLFFAQNLEEKRKVLKQRGLKNFSSKIKLVLFYSTAILHALTLTLLMALVDTRTLVWSNDAYESVEHRVVVNSEKERFSIPFFYLSHETEVKPLEKLINEQNP